MADRIWLDMQDLEIVNESLLVSITEFSNVADGNDDFEAAIGNPANRSSLQDRMYDFEADWNNAREDLNENLKKVQEHLQKIVDGFNQLDADLNSSLTGAEQQMMSNSGPNRPS
jgi:hypothetical protein